MGFRLSLYCWDLSLFVKSDVSCLNMYKWGKLAVYVYY